MKSLTSRHCVGVTLIAISTFVLLSQLAFVPNVASQQPRRTFENKIPKHVPLAVKIKNDKEELALDPANTNWFRDIEIEVTNTADKPIYFLSMNIIMPDVLTDRGVRVTFPLTYGSTDFFEHDNKALPKDIPIAPKATHVLTFDETFKIGYEAWRNKNNKSDPMKLELWISHLSFGDGTGFTSMSAVPFPVSQSPPVPGSEIRRFFNKAVPAHVPLAIKITKDTEEKALDPNNKSWFRDIEIAVTNTSDKPVYFLSLWLEMADVKNKQGVPIKFPLRYGRPELYPQDAKALPQDLPIEPNATYVFAFNESDKIEWEALRDRNNMSDPLTLEVILDHLSFGDGSGFTSRRGNVFVTKRPN